MKFIARFLIAFVLGVGPYYLIDLAEQAIWNTDAFNTKPATVIRISGIIAFLITASWERSGKRLSGPN
jgi:hypothetical protein